jgi:hypothetical protein
MRKKLCKKERITCLRRKKAKLYRKRRVGKRMKDLARLKRVLAIKNGNTANVAKKHIGSLQFQPNKRTYKQR